MISRAFVFLLANLWFLTSDSTSLTCETATCPPCYKCEMNQLGDAKCLIDFGRCCPDGRQPFICSEDPCKGVLCKSVANTTCLVDNCNNCKVKFYDDTLTELSLEECSPVNRAALCASLRCEDTCGTCDLSEGVAKCTSSTCPPTQTDESCSCPKCTKCYTNKKGDQKCIPDGSCCSDGSKPLKCKEKPCDTSICRKFPRAKCLTDFCGRCRAKFFDDLFDDVTQHCDDPVAPVIDSSPIITSNKTSSFGEVANGTQFATADFFFNSPHNSNLTVIANQTAH